MRAYSPKMKNHRPVDVYCLREEGRDARLRRELQGESAFFAWNGERGTVKGGFVRYGGGMGQARFGAVWQQGGAGTFLCGGRIS